MGREYELKYRADPGILGAMEDKYGPFTPIAMATTYFDTPDRALSRRRWTLRLRLEDQRPVCTAKIPLPDGSRGEWETVADSIEEALPLLVAQGAPKELLELTRPGVEPVCGARFTRLAALQRFPGCAVELALDQGVLFAGDRELPLCEAEVELKEGSELAAVAFALVLASEFSLTREPRSKAQRAMALAQGQEG